MTTGRGVAAAALAALVALAAARGAAASCVEHAGAHAGAHGGGELAARRAAAVAAAVRGGVLATRTLLGRDVPLAEVLTGDVTAGRDVLDAGGVPGFAWLARGVRGGDKPPQPYWPFEWVADLVQVNTSTNASRPFRESYSIANNATLAEFGNMTLEYDVYALYALGMQYALYGSLTSPTCYPSTLTGGLAPLPTELFTYQGTATFNGSPAYVWVGGSLTYLTDQTVLENPLALIDASTHIATVFTGFQAVPDGGWPTGYWGVPPQC